MTTLPGAGMETGLAQAPMEFQHVALQRLQTPGPLGDGVRRAAKWAIASRVTNQLIQFAGTLASARLLIPADYGKAAIIFPIVGFAALFSSLGLGSAVIHARLVTERLLSTAFWVNAVTGFALAGLLCGLSFPLASFFGFRVLVPLLCLASLNFGLDLAIVHLALLSRTLRFRQLAIREVGASLVTVAVLVATAAAGAGPFALVYGPVAGTIYTTITAWVLVRWLPRALPDRQSFRQLWHYGKGITGFSIFGYWARNGDNLLLARFAPQAAVGGYLRAYSLMVLPIDQMLVMMSRVMFPAMSRLRDQPSRLARSWLRALSISAVLTAPISVGTAVSAPALVEVLYGPRWAGIVTILELLAISALPTVLSATVPAILRATGANRRLLRLGMATSSLKLTAVGIGLPWGVNGVAAALAIESYLELAIFMRMALRETGLHASAVAAVVGPVLVACISLAVVGLLVRFLALPAAHSWVVFPVQIVSCAAAYFGTLAILDRQRLRDLLVLVRRKQASTV